MSSTPAAPAADGHTAPSFTRAVFLVAVVFSTFQVITAAFAPLSSPVVRAIHVGFLLLMTFTLYPPLAQRWLGWLLGAAAFAAGIYHWVFEADLVQRAGDLTNADYVVGIVTIVLVFEAARRVMGIALPIICGVFLDSPRRWRWDQRQRLRPGTSVPRVSPATRTFVAQVPRTLPKRPTATLQPADYLPSSAAPASGPGSSAGIPYLDAEDAIPGGAGDPSPEAGQHPDEDVDSPAAGLMTTRTPTGPAGASMPTERLDQAARAEGAQEPADTEAPGSEPGGIELPTSLEPKAQRSPWAWAAPPEWNRDEEDEPPSRSSGGR